MHITVDYDTQGRLILDHEGTKYEVTLESTDVHGITTPLALQPGEDTTNKIKALIAGLVKAHVLHDQVPSTLSQINGHGLLYKNGTLKDHDFTIYDANQGDAHKAATVEVVDYVAPHLEGTYISEMVKADTLWKRLEHLVLHPPVPPAPAHDITTFAFNPPSSGSSTAPQQLDPLRPISPRPSSLSPLSPPPHLFDDADEITTDLTIDLAPRPSRDKNKPVHFATTKPPAGYTNGADIWDFDNPATGSL